MPPHTDRPQYVRTSGVAVLSVDLSNVPRKDLAQHLKIINVVVSALNGEAVRARKMIMDSAVDPRVKRFHLSEYGMQNVYSKTDDYWSYVHPVRLATLS